MRLKAPRAPELWIRCHYDACMMYDQHSDPRLLPYPCPSDGNGALDRPISVPQLAYLISLGSVIRTKVAAVQIISII